MSDDEAYRAKIRRAVLAAILVAVTDDGVVDVKTELVVQALFEAIMTVTVTGCQRTGGDLRQAFKHVRQMARGLRADYVQVVTPAPDGNETVGHA